jgi:hypothetical protein
MATHNWDYACCLRTLRPCSPFDRSGFAERFPASLNEMAAGAESSDAMASFMADPYSGKHAWKPQDLVDDSETVVMAFAANWLQLPKND